MISIQDVSQDVVMARASSISMIMLDITQISASAFSNCTAAMVATVLSDPETAGHPSVAEQVVSALSYALELGSSMPPSLLSQISQAMAVLSAGMQASMARE